jgi:hypothetical protein
MREAVSCNALRCARCLIEADAEFYTDDADDREHILEYARSREMIDLLVADGEDINHVDRKMARELIGLEIGAELEVTEEEYRAGKLPEFGKSNPEICLDPFVRAMIRCGHTAHSARLKFHDEIDYDVWCKAAERVWAPVWCYERFGRSLTPLSDGRWVVIGGEHEDFYDPDYYVYNDVVVFDGRGDFTVYNYPLEVFPPTDSHSATLAGDYIYIIGSIGYAGTRDLKTTPVYRLNLSTWAIESVETKGKGPGWIFRHYAKNRDGQSIFLFGGQILKRRRDQEIPVYNEHIYTLDLKTMRWTRESR